MAIVKNTHTNTKSTRTKQLLLCIQLELYCLTKKIFYVCRLSKSNFEERIKIHTKYNHQDSTASEIEQYDQCKS